MPTGDGKTEHSRWTIVITRSVDPLGEFSYVTGSCAVFVRSHIHFVGMG